MRSGSWSVKQNNIAAAKVAGMQESLHLSSAQYATAVAIFFVGYISMQIPSNVFLAQLRPSIYLPVFMALWGTLSAMTGLTKNLGALYLIRFLLGFVEAAFYRRLYQLVTIHICANALIAFSGCPLLALLLVHSKGAGILHRSPILRLPCWKRFLWIDQRHYPAILRWYWWVRGVALDIYRRWRANHRRFYLRHLRSPRLSFDNEMALAKWACRRQVASSRRCRWVRRRLRSRIVGSRLQTCVPRSAFVHICSCLPLHPGSRRRDQLLPLRRSNSWLQRGAHSVTDYSSVFDCRIFLPSQQ